MGLFEKVSQVYQQKKLDDLPGYRDLRIYIAKNARLGAVSIIRSEDENVWLVDKCVEGFVDQEDYSSRENELKIPSSNELIYTLNQLQEDGFTVGMKPNPAGKMSLALEGTKKFEISWR